MYFGEKNWNSSGFRGFLGNEKKAGNHVKKTRRVTATLEILPCQDLRKLKLDMEPFDEEDNKRVSVFLQ